MYDPYGGGGGAPPPQVQTMGSAGPAEIGILQGRTKFLTKQKFEALEAIANAVGIDAVEFSNKYDIIDANTGETLYVAAEESNCCLRCLCKPNHPLKLHVVQVLNGAGTEAMVIDKPFRCNLPTLCDICAGQETTMLPQQETLGSTKSSVPFAGCISPSFNVSNAIGEDVMQVAGPCCLVGGICELCCDQEFAITGADDSPKGRIVHLSPGSTTEGLTEIAGDADRLLLELNDTTGVDTAQIANLLGTVLLLDYFFYENGSAFQGDIFAGTCSINICTFFCCGCTVPCHLTFGGEGGDGEGEDGGDDGGE